MPPGPPVPPLEPIPLPLPVGMVEGLLLVAFAAHILAVDVAVGGTVVALVHWIRGKKANDSKQLALAKDISRMLPTAIALLVNLAIPPLLFLQVLYGPFFYTSSILMGLPWIAVIPLLITGYTLSYRMRSAMKEGSRWTVAIGAGSALSLLSIGFILTNNVTLMLHPNTWADAYRSSVHGANLNFSDPTIWPRYAHMITGMLAGAGAFVACISLVKDAVSDADFCRTTGLRWFGLATLANFVVGPVFLFSQPEKIRAVFLGGSGALTGILWAGVLAAGAAVALALRAPKTGGGAKTVLLPIGLVGFTVACMVLVRDGVRRESLSEFGWQLSAHPVRADWITFSVFLVVLALGAFAVFRMAAWVLADLKLGARGMAPDVKQEGKNERVW
jgi:hypothetical protein